MNAPTDSMGGSVSRLKRDMKDGRPVIAASGMADGALVRAMAATGDSPDETELVAAALALSQENRRRSTRGAPVTVESPDESGPQLQTRTRTDTDLTIRLDPTHEIGIDAGSSFGDATAGAKLIPPGHEGLLDRYLSGRGLEPTRQRIGLVTSVKQMLSNVATYSLDVALFPVPIKNPLRKDAMDTPRGVAAAEAVDRIVAVSEQLEERRGRMSLEAYEGARRRLGQEMSKIVLECPEAAASRANIRNAVTNNVVPPHLYKLVDNLSPRARDELGQAVMLHETPKAMKGDLIGALKDAFSGTSQQAAETRQTESEPQDWAMQPV